MDIRIVEVQLEIREQYINRIGADSEVSIGSRGLIGDSFIDISPGALGGRPPRRGANTTLLKAFSVRDFARS